MDQRMGQRSSMALAEEVIAVVHNISNACLAVTLIGAPIKSAKDLTKSSEQCNFNDPTRDVTDETAFFHDSDVKKQKYSSMSAEVRPTIDRGTYQKKTTKKWNVGNGKDVNSVREKFKSYYTIQSCDQQHCPRIQERLTHHYLEHHSNYKKVDYACEPRVKIRDQAENKKEKLRLIRNQSPTEIYRLSSSMAVDEKALQFMPVEQDAGNSPDLLTEEVKLQSETKNIYGRRVMIT